MGKECGCSRHKKIVANTLHAVSSASQPEDACRDFHMRLRFRHPLSNHCRWRKKDNGMYFVFQLLYTHGVQGLARGDPILDPFRLTATTSPLQRCIGRMAVTDRDFDLGNCSFSTQLRTEQILQGNPGALGNRQNLLACLALFLVLTIFQSLLDLILQRFQFGYRQSR